MVAMTPTLPDTPDSRRARPAGRPERAAGPCETMGLVAGRATPATALLDRLGVAYSVHVYDHDPRAGGYGLEASDALGAAPERVFKTLVAEVDGALTVAVVPVAGQLDLKALAAAAGGKKAVMAEAAAAERATGYVAGGISPLGQRRRLPVVVDASVLEFPTVFCSGGRRGLEIELAPADLVRAAGALVAAIAVTTRQCGA
jgi:Cys-tRNA(Pro)/Cys-tRNA(Cys) deacylase